MARARFYEILRCAGVDEKAAGMVVPVRGTNQVVLETLGMKMKVTSNHSSIKLEEFDGKDITRQLIELNNKLYEPNVDPLFREAYLPSQIYLHKPRYFRVHGLVNNAPRGAEIKAVPEPVPGRRAPSIGATLRVLCLDKMILKVAIRNVTARDQQGNIRFHAKRPCNPDQEIKNMNAIWTPQANIRFDPIPSTDLLIDHDDSATQIELKKAFEVKETSRVSFSPESGVNVRKLSGLFARNKVPGAHITFFLVHQVISSSGPAEGLMDSELGIGFISGTHFPTTFAHEAGHYLGRKLEKGEWRGHEHLSPKEERLLMKEGGSSWAIPFDMVKRVRDFSGKPYSGPSP